MKTKYGNASIANDGYYKINTSKQGNHGKLLHRLIWEDFYNCEIPEGYVIHHKNGNKTDNCILNLQLMKEGEHHKLHSTGENNGNYGNPSNWKPSEEHRQKLIEINKKPKSDEHKINLSKSKNTTGYFRVNKQKDKTCKQGFRWRYEYFEDGKQKSIKSVDIEKLEEKVKAKGLLWRKFDDEC